MSRYIEIIVRYTDTGGRLENDEIYRNTYKPEDVQTMWDDTTYEVEQYLELLEGPQE